MRCYCASVRQAARRLTRFYEAELQEAGMNAAQFELMATVQGKPGLSQGELAVAIDVDQTTLSRNLKLLIERRWVMKTAALDDRRRVEYALTPDGRQILDKAMPCWERARKKMDDNLGDGAASVWAVLDSLSIAANR